MNFLDDLNPTQREAVECTEGPLMVLAGAGSGKTRVLTYRIAHLIESNKANPENILALTFTNKAAQEMKERIAHLAGNKAYRIWSGTFHSIFAQILRQNAHYIGFDKRFSILDTMDTLTSIKMSLKEQKTDFDKPKLLQQIISYLKNNKIEHHSFNADMLPYSYKSKVGHFIEDFYAKYETMLKKNNSMDFDDLLLKTYTLFKHHPPILEYYQQNFKYILVDEYQDTNKIQFLITKMLAQKNNNICIVGDDAQSIYSFRGAEIENILSFPTQNPQTKEIKLEQNYRSTSHIVNLANSLIKHNTKQHFKNIYTDLGEGNKVSLLGFDAERIEAHFVAREIKKLQTENNVPLSDIAILYRNNALSRNIEDALRNEDLDYKIYGGLSFYQRAEIKDIVAYIRLINNPQDVNAFVRIVNVPARSIGQTTIDKVTNFATAQGLLLTDAIEELTSATSSLLTQKTKTSLKGFVDTMSMLREESENLTIFELLKLLLQSTKYLSQYDKTKLEDNARIENIEQFLNLAKELELMSETQIFLTDFLEKISLTEAVEDQTKKDEEESVDKVSMLTLHTSKGLEYDYVFIVGVEQGILPSTMSDNDEEERRLFYVGITRTRRKLYLTYCRRRNKWGNSNVAGKSKFLVELDSQHIEEYMDYRKVDRDATSSKSHILNRRGQYTANKPVEKKLTHYQQYKVGDKVEHNLFGTGKIENITISNQNPIAHIYFESSDTTKKILINFAKMTKIV